jgi:hypothetical protein
LQEYDGISMVLNGMSIHVKLILLHTRMIFLPFMIHIA